MAYRDKERQREARRRWKKANPAKVLEYQQAGRLRRKYGLERGDFEALLEAQDGVCAICRGPEPIADGRRLAVDHDHKTGAVRGLLCSTCNRAVGLLKDDPETLIAAALYLEAAAPGVIHAA